MDRPAGTHVTRAFWEELHRETPNATDNAPWALIFVCFLRAVSRFGRFTFGPIDIDVRMVEELAAREPRDVNDFAAFSTALVTEQRRSGTNRVDELHYLLAFMRHGEGLPRRVFAELGVSPERVEAYARGEDREEPASSEHPGGLEPLLSPEEAAAYLKVHVETVRQWIRTGHLPASRIAGLRALRIRASDVQALLQPVDEPRTMRPDTARVRNAQDAQLPD